MKNTSFIIHYRKDCEDREFNLKTILNYLHTFSFKELFVINDDKQVDPLMKWIKQTFPQTKLLFCQNEDEFKKSVCFNKAAFQATGDVLCFYDVDVLVPLEQLKESEKLILNGNFDHVYPFNGFFIDVKKNIFEQFLPNFNFELLKEQITETNLGFFNGNVHVISNCSPGGCNLISKKAFENIKGFDQDFIGWGFEDTDFRERSKKVNRVKYLEGDKKFIFHLEHNTHHDQVRSTQPHYANNYKKFLQNIS